MIGSESTTSTTSRLMTTSSDGSHPMTLDSVPPAPTSTQPDSQFHRGSRFTTSAVVGIAVAAGTTTLCLAIISYTCTMRYKHRHQALTSPEPGDLSAGKYSPFALDLFFRSTRSSNVNIHTRCYPGLSSKIHGRGRTHSIYPKERHVCIQVLWIAQWPLCQPTRRRHNLMKAVSGCQWMFQ